MIAVRLTFNGASEHEYYELYIDPRTSLLARRRVHGGEPRAASRVRSTGGHQVHGPTGEDLSKHGQVGALTLPSPCDTYANGRDYGIHWARACAIDQPFDESHAALPDGATVDASDEAG